jgi:Asp/Glu/hydantoin racemase
MRIAILGTGHRPTGGLQPPAEILSACAPQSEPFLIETRVSRFPGTPEDRQVVDLLYLEAGYRAADAGADAIFVNTVGDYGLRELQNSLSVPAVGAGAAAMSLAAALGGQFSIVTIWPPALDFIYARVLEQCGLTSRCIGIRHLSQDSLLQTLGADDDFVETMRAGRASTIERVVAEADAALASDGAGAVMLGCTCMAPIAAAVQRAAIGPIIDPMTQGFRQTEIAVARQRASGTVPAPVRPAVRGAVRDWVAALESGVETECLPCDVLGSAD